MELGSVFLCVRGKGGAIALSTQTHPQTQTPKTSKAKNWNFEMVVGGGSFGSPAFNQRWGGRGLYSCLSISVCLFVEMDRWICGKGIFG